MHIANHHLEAKVCPDDDISEHLTHTRTVQYLLDRIYRKQESTHFKLQRSTTLSHKVLGTATFLVNKSFNPIRRFHLTQLSYASLEVYFVVDVNNTLCIQVHV